MESEETSVTLEVPFRDGTQRLDELEGDLLVVRFMTDSANGPAKEWAEMA